MFYFKNSTSINTSFPHIDIQNKHITIICNYISVKLDKHFIYRKINQQIYFHFKLYKPKCFFIKENLKKSLFLSLALFTSQAYTNIDFVILEKFHGDIIAGSYKISLILAQTIIPIYGALAHIFLSKNFKFKFKDKFVSTRNKKTIYFNYLSFHLFYNISNNIFSIIFKIFYKN